MPEEFSKPLNKEFWEKFLKNPIPEIVKSNVDVDALKNLVEDLSEKLLPSELKRAEKVIESLTNGASSCQKSNLPACEVKNSKTTETYSKEMTDTIAYWLKSGYVCGPFDEPPFKNFRVNSLQAVPQDNKVRPVLNVSRPEGQSFNDNIDKNMLEKVKMSSARNFGYSIKKCGKKAVFSKFDFRDAYKNMPAPKKDLRLQGFKWLGKFFFELMQMFGGITAVGNFDILGNTAVSLTCAICECKKEFVHRHLDDVPFVSTAESGLCEKFSKTYKEVCEVINLKLADNCDRNEKAFTNVTYGKVLGIWFNSENLSWHLLTEKKEKTLRCIHMVMNTVSVTLLEMQKLMGNLNNVSLMCPFLNGFRRNLNDCLSAGAINDCIFVTSNAKNDLLIWAGFLLDTVGENSIPSCPTEPTIVHKSFTSDAAGYASDDGVDRPGVASIGFDEEGKIIFAFQKLWAKKMISGLKDNKGKEFGRKTAFLEFVGILIPFILMPEKLCNQHIVLKVDNISCHYGWLNRSMKNDAYTSILIRALHVISSYLCSVIHVQHLPRESTWDSRLVDRMSRESSITQDGRLLLNSFSGYALPPFFVSWLDSPVEEWSIALQLLVYVKSIIER